MSATVERVRLKISVRRDGELPLDEVGGSRLESSCSSGKTRFETNGGYGPVKHHDGRGSKARYMPWISDGRAEHCEFQSAERTSIVGVMRKKR
jgi:hypothetical protein